jgi:ABC-type multidrug transport system permease subunit
MPDRRVRPALFELTLSRFREFAREPEAIFWVFAFPVLMTVALGIAFRAQAPKPVPVGVDAVDGAEAVMQALGADPGMAPRLLAEGEADVALRNGAVHVVVRPGAPPAFRFDPTRPESRAARVMADATLQRAAGRADVWHAQDQEVIAPGSRYIDWLVPGLLGMNIMGTGLWGIGFGVVNARVRKLLKRLVATPMRRADYLMSHVLSRLIFLCLEVVVIVGFARLAFGIPLNGSLAILAGLCLLGALSFGGLGLLLASRAKTLEAVSGLMNLAMLPMWVLSGVFFSSENFPAAVQPAIDALPLTALNQALRANMIDGAPLAAIGSQVAILAAWGAGCFLVALRVFRWR